MTKFQYIVIEIATTDMPILIQIDIILRVPIFGGVEGHDNSPGKADVGPS
jgi:hypothetical protein